MSNLIKLAKIIDLEEITVDVYQSNRLSKQWWAKMGTDIDQAVKTPKMGAGIKVCVLDTGAGIHKELDIKGGVNFTTEDANDYIDRQGHGTHVCGIISQIAPECEIHVVKVLADNGSGQMDWIMKGIEYAIDIGASVINMSLGSSTYYGPLHNLVKLAVRKGIVICAAAGNESDNDVETEEFSYPGALHEVISVGSVNRKQGLSKFSNTNREVDIVAPGEHIYSLAPNDKYVVLSGTSMATPFVAGITALVLAERPDLDPDGVRELLEKSATDAGDPGYDFGFGNGIINLDKLLDLV